MTTPADPWEDPRILSGLEKQLAARRELLDSGARPIGWKVGFGAPASLELMGISQPLMGYLTDSTQLASGQTVDVSSWERAVVEFELAVSIGADVGHDATPAAAARAVAAVAPAIELANIDLAVGPEAVADVVAGNIFHAGLVLGSLDTSRAGLNISGLVANIVIDGVRRATVTELEQITGRYPEVVATVAKTLSAAGETLRAGDVIITGSVVPPIAASEGSVFEFELDPLEPISVVVTAAG